MKQTFEPGQTVYLPDGRQAEYVTSAAGEHLVRVILEVEDAYDEPDYTYPDDKITAAQTVYASAPVEVWDKQVLAKREQVRELDRELGNKRAEIRLAERNKAEMEKAAAKYPCIQQALDFIEGRITHVVKHGYDGATIHKMPEAFEQIDTWHGRRKHEGMKLLNLFGTDEHGRGCAWGLNTYRDGSGSGSTTAIWPARSEAEARAKVEELVDAALEAWRSGDEKWWVGHVGVKETFNKNPWLEEPNDWAAHVKTKQAEAKAQKIAKLKEEIAKLEGD